jgi:DNA replication protein DnaC
MKAKTTDPTTLLRDRCLSHFTMLRIPVQPAALDELLTRAEKENLAYLSFLDRLLGAEAGARRERAVARRIRDAHFPENKTLEGFDWNFNPKTFNRVQMEELATGDFIRRRTNFVLVGWSGIGKSHMIQAIGQRACVHGYRVLYQTSAQLLADLTASLADKTLPARLRRFAKPDLLIIDECEVARNVELARETPWKSGLHHLSTPHFSGLTATPASQGSCDLCSMACGTDAGPV